MTNEQANNEIIELVCNIDAMTPEALAFACTRLLEQGALDVYTTPTTPGTMKKGRAGHELTVLCTPEYEADMAAHILKRQDYFVCANYRRITDKCSAHYIRAVVLEDMVWRHMQMVISYVANHEAYFRAVMGDKLKLASDEAIRVNKKKLAKAEKRLNELDRIFMRLYEDRVNGTISDGRFASMSKSYENEQEKLKREVETLTKEMDQQETGTLGWKN